MRRLAVISLALTLVLWGLAVTVNAQESVPPPYAGLKNPFPWDDPAVQQEGKKLYQKSCLACHGADGSSLATANFSTANFPKQLEEKPDFYFWISNEGRLTKGMPPFKSSLSGEQQWQVLTYLWSLSQAPPAGQIPTAPKETPAEEVALWLATPQVAQVGQTLTLTATLRDTQDKPIEDAVVTFFVKQEFFTSGLMEIGQRPTDDKGSASIRYVPKEIGQTEFVARYKAVEKKSQLSVTDSGGLTYEANAGINLPAPGEEVFIGPGAHGLGEMGEAPTFAFRLPGGVLSWLLILVATVLLIWMTYFRVLYQVLCIPIAREITDTNTRFVPFVGLTVVIAVGVFLMLKLVTGPYSHFHLLP